MRTPTAADLLDVWDRGRGLSMPRRALLLLEAADVGGPSELLASLPLGQRDLLLLELRAGLFGDDIAGLVRCPACGETVESRFSARDVAAGTAPSDRTGSARLACEAGGWRVGYRLPTSADAVSLAEHPGASGRDLVARCVLDAQGPEALEPQAPFSGVLPDEVVASIAAGMAQADPHADILLDVECPACAHRWSPPFDVAAFLWIEVSAWARRLLRDVVVLARAFGWREADILALSPQRRGDYLELAGG